MIPARAVHIVYYQGWDCCMALQNAADRACFRDTAKQGERSPHEHFSSYAAEHILP